MDPQVTPDAGPISRDYRVEWNHSPGAVIRPKEAVGAFGSLLLSPVLSEHRLHLVWLVGGGDEYDFRAELVFFRNRIRVLTLPLETHYRPITADPSPVKFAWSACVAGDQPASNPAQIQYTDPTTGLTVTKCVPAFEFSAEADACSLNILRNDAISGSAVTKFWGSALLFCRKP
jgi:hypothetical protein